MPGNKNKCKSYFNHLNTEIMMQLVYHLNIVSLCIRFLAQSRSKVTHLFIKTL